MVQSLVDGTRLVCLYGEVDNHPTKVALDWIPQGCKRPKDHCKMIWHTTVKEELGKRNTIWFHAF